MTLAFVPYALSVPEEPRPHTAFLLHGILGNHTNWRTFARTLSEELPDWRFLLVDLRNHGLSEHPPGPHTLAAAADDLERLAAQEGAPEVVMGHSYGGKVTLEYASRRPAGLRQAWVLDATPQAEPHGPGDDNEVLTDISALRAVPQPLDKRQDVMVALAHQGMSPMIQRWMTTNLQRTDEGFVWTFDLDAAEEMIGDYFRQDLWEPLETTALDAPALHLVRAGRSDRWTPDVMERLDRLSPSAAATVHVLPDAGHWVHVDAPDALRTLLVEHWPAERSP